jgi:glucokinase
MPSAGTAREPIPTDIGQEPQMADTCVLAMDVGGTRIKAGIVDPDARVRAERVIGTGCADGPDAVAERLLNLIDELAATARSTGLTPVATGVVVPGIIDETAGQVIFSANVGWREFPLGAHLAKRTDMPTAVGHDVRAGGLAEAVLGAGQGENDQLFVAIGTGIAGAIIMDGRPYTGGGYAGEIGHVQVDPHGRRCGCGGLGCLETVAAASAIAARYAERRVNEGAVSAEEVARRAAGGEPLAAQIWRQAVDGLTTALVAYVSICAPRLIVIGGGLAESGEVLLGPLRRELTARLTFQRPPRIVRAGLGDRAGLLGAALMAWRTAGG